MLDKNNDLVVDRNTPLAFTANGFIIPTDDPALLSPTDKRFRFRELLAGKTIIAHGENMHYEMSYRRGTVYVFRRLADQESAMKNQVFAGPRYKMPLAEFLKYVDIVLVD
ncbi:MAG: hypothetical protein WC645_07920 [Candidatus Margulisiibacteriota bacterium]